MPQSDARRSPRIWRHRPGKAHGAVRARELGAERGSRAPPEHRGVGEVEEGADRRPLPVREGPDVDGDRGVHVGQRPHQPGRDHGSQWQVQFSMGPASMRLVERFTGASVGRLDVVRPWTAAPSLWIRVRSPRSPVTRATTARPRYRALLLPKRGGAATRRGRWRRRSPSRCFREQSASLRVGRAVGEVCGVQRRLDPIWIPCGKRRAAGYTDYSFGICKLEWCRGPESNWRHHDFQSCALPTELPRLECRPRTKPEQST